MMCGDKGTWVKRDSREDTRPGVWITHQGSDVSVPRWDWFGCQLTATWSKFIVFKWAYALHTVEHFNYDKTENMIAQVSANLLWWSPFGGTCCHGVGQWIHWSPHAVGLLLWGWILWSDVTTVCLCFSVSDRSDLVTSQSQVCKKIN